MSLHSVRLYYSYSTADEELRQELEQHLALMRRRGLLTTWGHTDVSPGDQWADARKSHIDDADIVLLLVSASFMGSDACFNDEMQRALARHQSGSCRVVPVLLRPVDWHQAPFAKLRPLPRGGLPITSWGSHDEAWQEVARDIRQIIEAISVDRASMPATVAGRESVTAVHLRVMGTPYAYQGLPGAESITLGRQRRKPGAPPAEGNDIVLRVEDREQDSLRISRRHLEIIRQGQSYFVITYGRAGTRLNGVDISSTGRTPIQPGDRLLVAGVITLEFQVNFSLPTDLCVSHVYVPLGQAGQAVMQATIGDMITVDP